MRTVLKENKDLTTTVRFDFKQRQLIEVCAKVNSVSRSRVVQEAVKQFFKQK